MKKSKRILSAITALAISASAFASLVIPASAAETQLFSYDFESGSPWAISYGGSYEMVKNTFASVTGVTGKVYDLRSNAEVTGGRTATLTMPEAKSADYLKLTFDWFTYNTNRNNGDDLTFEDSNGNKIFTIGDRGEKVVIGSTTTELGFNQWYTIEAVLDFNTKQVITATASQNSEVKATVKHIPFESTAATDLGKLFVNFYRSSGNNSDSGSGMMIDNFTGSSVTDTYKTLTLNVSKGGTATADADVTFDGASGFKTDANGQVKFGVADGTYAYEVSAAGCEDASGNAKATGSVTVSGASATESVEYGLKTYTAVPTTVNILTGPRSMTAPITAETAVSEAYTVEVFDQETLPINDATVVWSIEPADENVRIDSATGVVTVARGFDGGTSHVKDFTVKATATKNSQSREATRALKISDYMFYESGIEGSSYGETEAHAVGGTNYITTGSTKNQTNTITLPEPITFTEGTAETLSFDVAMTNKNVYTFKRNISIVGTGKDKDDKTIASIDFVNNDIGTDAAWDSKNSTLGTTWGSVSGMNTWENISILFATYANGTTKATLTIGGNEFDLGTVDAENISKITLNVGDCGTGTDRYVAMKDIIIKAEDASALDIGGSKNFTSIPGNTITKDYEILALMVEEGETFNWSTTIPNATITADANDQTKAVLTVPGTVTTGGTITVNSNKSRTATINVTVAPAVPTSFDFNGPSTIDYDEGVTEKYSITNVKDQNGDDITAYVTPEWSLKGRAAVTLPKATFTVDASAVGKDAVAIFPTYDGTELDSIETAPVKITGTTVDVEGKNGQKVLLWDSLTRMEPLAQSATVTGTDVNDTNFITNTGSLTINAKQNETVVATILGTPVEKAVTIAEFSKYVTKDDDADTEVEVNDIVTYGTTSFNLVLDDGTVVPKTATAGKIALTEADFGDSEEGEIYPNYKFDLGGASESGYVKVTGTKDGGYGFTSAATPAAGTGTGIQSMGVDLDGNSFEVDLPDGRYDMTFYKADTNRTHIRVNGYMTVTEADFNDGDDGTYDPIKAPGVYTKLDVNVTGGVAKVNAYNWDKGVPKMAAVEITKKSDEFQPRKTHVWIAGDSTVCIYRPSPTTDNFEAGTRRTGWGQLLQNYLDNTADNSVIVDDFAHSGDWTINWEANTLPSVLQNAEKGDYLIIQFGINDRKDSDPSRTTATMKTALEKIVDKCRAKGVIPVIQTPELCISQYGSQVTEEHTKPTGSGHGAYFDVNRTVAKEKNTLFIDLADISGTMWGTMGRTWVSRNYFLWNISKNEQSDPQHMSYQGAKLVASMVATEILDQQAAGKTGATGETFDGIPVNAKVQANVTYTDASDNQQKTIERQAAEFKATVLKN